MHNYQVYNLRVVWGCFIETKKIFSKFFLRNKVTFKHEPFNFDQKFHLSIRQHLSYYSFCTIALVPLGILDFFDASHNYRNNKLSLLFPTNLKKTFFTGFRIVWSKLDITKLFLIPFKRSI